MVEPISVLHNSKPNGVPTMLRDQTRSLVEQPCCFRVHTKRRDLLRGGANSRMRLANGPVRRDRKSQGRFLRPEAVRSVSFFARLGGLKSLEFRGLTCRKPRIAILRRKRLAPDAILYHTP
jgi:hypothetical protein